MDALLAWSGEGLWKEGQVDATHTLRVITTVQNIVQTVDTDATGKVRAW